MAKVIQYNKKNAPVTVDAPKVGAVVDVSPFGPLTIAVQVVLTAASTPSGITAILQGSIDGITYFDIGSSISLAANSTLKLSATSVEFKFYRVGYARASGSIVSTETFLIYGDR